jgi:Cytochrome c
VSLRSRSAALALALALGSALGCPRSTPSEGRADAAARAVPLATAKPGDAAHGKELVRTYECNRCHDGTGHEAAAQAKHCVHCHADIDAGRFAASPAALATWRPRVKDLTLAPSLEAAGKRLTRSWIEQYLLRPTDLRPHLSPSMPRLAISVDDARDLAAYLVPVVERPVSEPLQTLELAGADLGRGRQLLETKGCGSCHAFTGVAPLPSAMPPAMSPKELAIGHALAPDLRFARARSTPAKLVAWLQDPPAVKHDTRMPRIPLTASEVKDLVGYLFGTEVTAPRPIAARARLPLLTRNVGYQEVDDRVFHRTCWHCHSEPDYAIGDGGPGNSGGFGFAPRGLNLSSYAAIAAGFVDERGERQSVFAKDAQGVPRLVRALLARSEEERGAETGDVRGMPLGYEPLSAEDIQLVDSWIAQGRPR